jgi:hypothetical protein
LKNSFSSTISEHEKLVLTKLDSFLSSEHKMSTLQLPELADIPVDMQRAIVGYLNIYHVGAFVKTFLEPFQFAVLCVLPPYMILLFPYSLLLTSKTNLKSRLLSWAKILNIEASLVPTGLKPQHKLEYLDLLLDTLIAAKAQPEVLILNAGELEFPAETHDKLAQLAPHFRILHLHNYEGKQLPWLALLNPSHLIDLKFSFGWSVSRADDAEFMKPFLEHIGNFECPALKRLTLQVRAQERKFIQMLSVTVLPNLETLTIEFGTWNSFKEELLQVFGVSAEERARLRPKLSCLNFVLNRSTSLEKPDFLNPMLGIDLSQPLNTLPQQVERLYGVSIDGFLIDSRSLWLTLLGNKWCEIDDPYLPELCTRCYPEKEATEALVRSRVSELCNIPTNFNPYNGWNNTTHREYICTAWDLLQTKCAEFTSKWPSTALHPFLDAPFGIDLPVDPVFDLYMNMTTILDYLKMKDEAEKCWLETRALLSHRIQMPYLLSRLKHALLVRFFDEPMEWWSQFDVNQRYITPGSIHPLWQMIETPLKMKFLSCPSFDPNCTASSESGDILTSLIETSKSFTDIMHLGVQTCLPRMDPVHATTSWFFREEDWRSVPETRTVVFNYILKHWAEIRPTVRLMSSLETFELLKKFTQETNQPLPEALVSRLAGFIWKKILTRTSKKEELLSRAKEAIESIGVIPDAVRKFAEGDDSCGIASPLGGEATDVLRQLMPKEENSCIVS